MEYPRPKHMQTEIKETLKTDQAESLFSGERGQRSALPHNPWLQAVQTCGSLIVFVALFIVLSRTLGQYMEISALVPVVTVGLLFGMKPAVLLGLLSLPANTLLRLANGFAVFDESTTLGTFIVGTLATTLIGAVFGRLRDMRLRYRQELQENVQAEAELRKQTKALEWQTGEMGRINRLLEQESRELQHTMDEMHRTKEELENLINTSLDPIVICDSHAKIVSPNRSFLELVDCSEEEAIGKKLHKFSAPKKGVYECLSGEQVQIEEDFFRENAEMISELYQKGGISGWSTYLCNREGKLIPVKTTNSLLYSEAGEVVGYFAIIRNITAQKRTEHELIASKEIAETANEAKSTFLANMSHEIRTPMNGIIGFTDILLESELNPEQTEYVDTIKRSGEALLSLIDDILDFSKVEAGVIEMMEAECDIEMLAYDVCNLIRPKVEKKSVRVVYRIDDEVPAGIKTDPHRFRQVLLNLMGNAAKFTESGEIELAFAVQEQKDSKICIHATVRDTGIGVPADKLESIFHLFQQADDSTTRQFGGTGLGLSICRKIAFLMGGNVWAESKPGRGSTFHFTSWATVSADRPAQHSAVPSPADKSVLSVSTGKAPIVNRYSVQENRTAAGTILLAEDNPINQKLASKLLAKAGCSVDVAENGRKAVELYAAAPEKYDMILMDVQMPELSGLDATRQIRSLEAQRNEKSPLPIIAVTANVMKGDREKCLAAGMNDYIAKPVKREIIFEMLQKWVLSQN